MIIFIIVIVITTVGDDNNYSDIKTKVMIVSKT